MDRKDEEKKEGLHAELDRKVEEKKERMLAALDRGMVMIHLDARRQGVLVPRHLASEPHLRLNVSYRFEPPDLSVSEWGIRSTLSFSGSRFKVAVPWSALFAITSHASKEFWLYPDDMPQELLQQAIAHARSAREEPERIPPAKPKMPFREVTREKRGEEAERWSVVKPKAPFHEVVGEKCGDGDDDRDKPRVRGHLRIIK